MFLRQVLNTSRDVEDFTKTWSGFHYLRPLSACEFTRQVLCTFILYTACSQHMIANRSRGRRCQISWTLASWARLIPAVDIVLNWYVRVTMSAPIEMRKVELEAIKQQAADTQRFWTSGEWLLRWMETASSTKWLIWRKWLLIARYVIMPVSPVTID